jgi:protein TonB
MIRNVHHAGLVRFLLLSSGLHLLFLLGVDRSPDNAIPHYLGQPVVNVELLDATRAPSTRPETPPPVPPSDAEKYASPQYPPLAADTAQKPGPGTADSTGSELRNQLLGELQTHLSRYLVYPPLARERGWEGTVLLGLRVESDGHLEEIRVERSSGYAVLDHSALNSLNRLGQIAGVSAWLNGRGMDMQLPVIYRLVEY